MDLARRLVAAEPSLGVQVTLVLIHACFWQYVVRYLSSTFVSPYVRSQPWVKRFSRRNDEAFRGIGVRFKSEEKALSFILLFTSFVLIHVVGGLLALPSLLLGPSPLTWACAAQGALVEVGWELSDTIVRLYEVTLGGPEGRDMNPPSLLFLVLAHHLMGIGMIVPMNLHRRGDAAYHELVFLLQFGAFVGMISQFYGYTLDVSTVAGLRRMQIAATVTLATFFWTRGYRFAVVSLRVLRGLDDGPMRVGGVVAIAGMATFNAAVLYDSTRRFCKFCLPPRRSFGRSLSSSTIEAFSRMPSDGELPDVVGGR